MCWDCNVLLMHVTYVLNCIIVCFHIPYSIYNIKQYTLYILVNVLCSSSSIEYIMRRQNKSHSDCWMVEVHDDSPNNHVCSIQRWRIMKILKSKADRCIASPIPQFFWLPNWYLGHWDFRFLEDGTKYFRYFDEHFRLKSEIDERWMYAILLYYKYIYIYVICYVVYMPYSILYEYFYLSGIGNEVMLLLLMLLLVWQRLLLLLLLLAVKCSSWIYKYLCIYYARTHSTHNV